jgi:hypothetical protein
MANYPPIKSTSIEHSYIIQSENKSYILRTRESSDTILIYIGGYQKYCIECQIFTENSFMKRIKDITIGDLPHVYYNEGCAINQRFIRGDDTKRILRLLIAFIRNTYPNIRGLMLYDESYRECDDGLTVDLAIMYYILHGKTWYMSTLDAKIAYESDLKYFNECEANFHRLKNEMPWEQMNEFITVALPIDEKSIKNIYNTSETWQVFFTNIRNHIGISDFCSFIAPWIKTFMKTLFKFDFGKVKYIISLDSDKHIPLLSYHLEPYKQKGSGFYKKYTQKNRRKKLRDLK